MAGIFLSYAREDRAFAEKLSRVLNGAGHTVWWDRHIGSGREFAGEIEAELSKADVVLVAWSQAAAKSPWVRDEAAIGRDRGRLLPVLVDGSEPPIGFRQLQALDLTGWSGRRNDRRTTALVEAVESVAGGSVPDLPKPARLSGWRKGRRPRLIAAALALILAVAAGLYVFNATRAEAEPASLAVLPFKNMAAGDPYFAEGVAEEIANQLGREPQFKVAGRTSSALFKDAADLRDVGRRLHVAYVLEGSVRSAGKQVRVAVSLVNAKSGARMWSQDFRGSLDDIFAIQDSIGEQVAAHVKRQLVTQAGAGDALRTKGDVYSLYVTARSLIRTREPAKLTTAVDLLQRAVKLDPNYAPAWARLAQALYMSRFYGHEYEARSGWTRPDELEAVNRAVSLAPNLAEAHAVVWLLSDAPNMSKEMKRRGRLALERAVKLDPTDAQSWYWLYIVREKDLDFEGALAAVRRTAEIDPFFTFSDKYAVLAWDMGEREAAMRFVTDRIRDHPDPYIRERAREMIAYGRADWSAIYGHLKRERELAVPDMRPYSNLGMGLVLMRLGLFDAARPHFEDPWILDLWSGKSPSPENVRELDPETFWLNLPSQLLARVLINNGRAAEIVSLYDRAFRSPGAMLERAGKLDFVEVAPIAASALREVGRGDEAMTLLITADRLCAGAMKRGRTPIDFQVNCSRTWAMVGRRDQVIRTLERALGTGWGPEGGWSWRLVDEPVYRSMRDDPRLRRVGAFVLAENARERRELLAEGI